MKIRLYILILIFLLFTPVNAETIKGGISYSIDIAKELAFKNLNNNLDMYLYKKNLNDPYYISNKRLLEKGRYKYRNRYLTKFSNGCYSVFYKENPNENFYYDKNGHLIYITIDERKHNEYPFRTIKYKNNGTLEGVGLYTEYNKVYMFDNRGYFAGVWIGENCYNEKGELIMTRE